MSGRCTNCGRMMCECPPGVNKNLPEPPVEMLVAAKRYHEIGPRPGWSAEYYHYVRTNFVADEQGLWWPRAGRKTDG